MVLLAAESRLERTEFRSDTMRDEGLSGISVAFVPSVEIGIAAGR